MRNACFRDGQFQDKMMMSILSEEKIKCRFMSKIQPINTNKIIKFHILPTLSKSSLNWFDISDLSPTKKPQ
jgi:hypothetical protein